MDLAEVKRRTRVNEAILERADGDTDYIEKNLEELNERFKELTQC